MSKQNKRIGGIDTLRSIAVLLVICRHGVLEDNLCYQFGWLGVDLFFVISGFLVSGLLLEEFKSRGKINIKRFLIRRAFKIYPSFYFLLLVSVCHDFLVANTLPEPRHWLAEIFYVQNYFPAILTHSWSLAVEEHFYILLALCAYLILRYKIFFSYKKTVITMLSLILLQAMARSCWVFLHANESINILYTHMRGDGILIGVLVAMIVHYSDLALQVYRYRMLFIPLACCMLLPGFIYPAGSMVMNSFGISLTCLGFGLLVLLVAGQHQIKPIHNRWVKITGFIGVHSYSIYLWHLLGNAILLHFFHFNDVVMMALYVIFSLALGIFFSHTVERFSLKMRESSVVRSWVKE